MLLHDAAIALHIARREARLQMAYRNQFLTDVLSHFLGVAPIILVTIAMSGSEIGFATISDLTRQNLLFVFLGYTAFTAFGFGTPVMLYTGMGYAIHEEVNTGTIERNLLAPTSHNVIMLGISLYYVVLYSYHTLTLIVLAVILGGDNIRLTLGTSFTAAAAVIGLLFVSLGLGFAASGFFLRTRDSSLFLLVVQRPFMVFSGAVFLIDMLPRPLEIVARINPVTYGIDAFRGSLAGRPTLMSAEAELLALYAGGILIFIAGVACFKRSMRHQLVTGELVRY